MDGSSTDSADPERVPPQRRREGEAHCSPLSDRQYGKAQCRHRQTSRPLLLWHQLRVLGCSQASELSAVYSLIGINLDNVPENQRKPNKQNCSDCISYLDSLFTENNPHRPAQKVASVRLDADRNTKTLPICPAGFLIRSSVQWPRGVGRRSRSLRHHISLTGDSISQECLRANFIKCETNVCVDPMIRSGWGSDVKGHCALS